MGTRRQGLSSLVSAIGLVAVLSFVAFFHFGLSRQSMSSVQRAHLSALARIQARSAIEELLDQVSQEANDPESQVFRLVRENLDGPWDLLDLQPYLRPPEVLVTPTWGRRVADGPERRSDVAGRVVEYLAILRAPRRSVDPLGTEELVALLTLTVVAEASGPTGKVRRLVSATYEVRAVLTHPPRPFDQVALFVQGLEAVVDVGRANALRAQLVAAHEALRQEFLQLAATRPGPVGVRFGELAASMSDPTAIATSTPPLPTTPGAVLFGPYHAHAGTPGSAFDLAARLEALEAERLAADQAFRAALGDDAAVGPAAFRLLSAHGRVLDALWRYRVSNTILTPDEPRYQREIAPYLPRLDPAYFLDRVHLAARHDDELVQRWQAGHARLNGLLELATGGAEVRLPGDPKGRLVILVDGGRVLLGGGSIPPVPDGDDPPEPSPEDRLVVVSMGADVRVEGDARAAVLMLPGRDGGPAGTFELGQGATLVGSVLAPGARPGQLSLQGTLRYDPTLATPFPPSRTLDAMGPGHYVVVVSPAPIFQAGVR